jgi:hypothetical protein
VYVQYTSPTPPSSPHREPDQKKHERHTPSAELPSRTHDSVGPQFSSLAQPGSQCGMPPSTQRWPTGHSPGKHEVTPVRDVTTQPAAGWWATWLAHGSQRPTTAAPSRTQVSRGPQLASLAQPGRHDDIGSSRQYCPTGHSLGKQLVIPLCSGPGHTGPSAPAELGPVVRDFASTSTSSEGAQVMPHPLTSSDASESMQELRTAIAMRRTLPRIAR